MTVWEELESSRALGGLERQLASGAGSHAWLLLGPSGSGKRAAATAIAAALNCRVSPGVGCGECSSCTRIARLSHPDVHHVAPEGPLIPVDVVREQITPEAARSPFEGTHKVFIIEEADRMNPAAQSALLKSVEEPHEDTVFVLVSDDEEELLETLRSRCRVVRLDPVPRRRLEDSLARHGVDPNVATLAARVSDGDVERARELALDASASERRALWRSLPGRLSSPLAALDAAAEVLDQARRTAKEREVQQKAEVSELAEAMGEGRGTAAARNALAKRHRRELKRLEEEVLGEALLYLASFYRDVVAMRRGAPEAVTNIDAVGTLERWVVAGPADDALLLAAERCLLARSAFAFNANATLAIEATFVALSRLDGGAAGRDERPALA